MFSIVPIKQALNFNPFLRKYLCFQDTDFLAIIFILQLQLCMLLGMFLEMDFAFVDMHG
jgi:hypothetical protein